MPDFVTDARAQGLPRVEVSITRRLLDVKYTQMLMRLSDLTLRQVVLHDRVQKQRDLLADQVRELKKLKLLEGCAPNYLISSKVGVWTDQKARCIRKRGMNDKQYQDVVLQYLQKYGQATRQELDDLLLTKLPGVLDMQQQANKIKNLLQVLRRTGKLQSARKRPQIMWRLTGSDKTPLCSKISRLFRYLNDSVTSHLMSK